MKRFKSHFCPVLMGISLFSGILFPEVRIYATSPQNEGMGNAPANLSTATASLNGDVHGMLCYDEEYVYSLLPFKYLICLITCNNEQINIITFILNPNIDSFSDHLYAINTALLPLAPPKTGGIAH